MAQSTVGAAEEVRGALRRLGPDLPVDAPAPGRPADPAEVRVGGLTLAVEARAVVRESDAHAVARQLAARLGSGRRGLVVADRVSEGARSILRQEGIGWLDRRGSLRIVGPGMFIDTTVPGVVSTIPAPVDPWSPLGMDVAIDLLEDPERPAAPVAVARRVGNRSHSRISVVLAELRQRHLLGRDGLPTVPELFWELAEKWTPRWVPLALVPTGGEYPCKVGGTVGAVRHGAPLIAGRGLPPDLYVPDRQTLRNLLSTGGRTVEDAGGPAARVAVCPSRHAWDLDGPDAAGLPLAARIVVALDLAQDPRGREALAAWEPSDGPRVW